MKCSRVLATTLLLSAVNTAHSSFLFDDSYPQTPLPANNDFAPDLAAFGYDSMVINEQLRVSENGTVTLRFIGSESGYTNNFSFNGSTIFTETQTHHSFNYAGYDTGLGQSLSFSVFADDILDFRFASANSGALSPVDNADALNLGGLGLIYDSSLSTYYSLVLAYDDQFGYNDDDNHDDMLVVAEFTPVPIPGALVLFASGLFGLLSMRKTDL